MSDDKIKPVKIEKRTIAECSKCGKERHFSFHPGNKHLAALATDHESMCSSDSPVFEIKEQSTDRLFTAEQINAKYNTNI